MLNVFTEPRAVGAGPNGQQRTVKLRINFGVFLFIEVVICQEDTRLKSKFHAVNNTLCSNFDSIGLFSRLYYFPSIGLPQRPLVARRYTWHLATVLSAQCAGHGEAAKS